MIQLRLVVPPQVGEPVLRALRDDPRVTHLLSMPGAGVDPAGDVVQCDVSREAASDVLDALREVGVDESCAIALQEVAAEPSMGAHSAELAAPGSPDDGIVWDIVVERAADGTRSSWSYHTFLALATALAAVAVITDSPVLVVGAMVLGPEFGPVSALAVAGVLRKRRLAEASLRLLVAGFAVAIVGTAALAVLARLVGWLDAVDIVDHRALTGFISHPDRWSVVVALLAGAAGVLSLTAGRASALVGVFISVTTVPAAGNMALGFALGVPAEALGSAAQLGLNLACMTLAGTLVLAIQRIGTRHRR